MITIRSKYGILLLACLLPCCSESKESPKIDPNQLVGFDCDKPVDVNLVVSNQSPDMEEVDIRISIDGQLIVYDDFKVLNHHNFHTYRFKLCYGTHSIYAESKEGGVHLKKKFAYNEGNEEISVAFWYYEDPKSWQSKKKELTLNVLP